MGPIRKVYKNCREVKVLDKNVYPNMIARAVWAVINLKLKVTAKPAKRL